MEKFIPFEKLSKKKQKELNAARRGSWGALNPVTRRSPNPKAYNRQKARQWMHGEHPDAPSVFSDGRGDGNSEFLICKRFGRLFQFPTAADQ